MQTARNHMFKSIAKQTLRENQLANEIGRYMLDQHPEIESLDDYITWFNEAIKVVPLTSDYQGQQANNLAVTNTKTIQ